MRAATRRNSYKLHVDLASVGTNSRELYVCTSGSATKIIEQTVFLLSIVDIEDIVLHSLTL
jgi:hypothetical protein